MDFHSKNIPKENLLERRKSHRIPIHMLITYWVDNRGRAETYKVESINLSEAGIFIQLETPLALGTEVFLHFQLPQTRQDIAVQGKVVWTRDYKEAENSLPGKGIKFLNMDRETSDIFKEYLRAQGYTL